TYFSPLLNRPRCRGLVAFLDRLKNVQLSVKSRNPAGLSSTQDTFTPRPSAIALISTVVDCSSTAFCHSSSSTNDGWRRANCSASPALSTENQVLVGVVMTPV